jgi:hypothetical protein
VWWVDSASTEGWIRIEAAKELECLQVVTIGFLVVETDTELTIASAWAMTEAGEQEQVSGMITIPKVAIQHRIELAGC